MQIFPELPALIDAASARLIDTVTAIQNDPRGGANADGTARLVLTGGTAGIALLRRIAELEAEECRIDWARVHVFFGDERNVPVDHPDSNEGQAREALLDHVAIPAANIHGYGLDGGDMGGAVAAYAETLAQYAPQGFDIHLLGMGGEGHINSLFPHTDAVRETDALVLAVTDSPKPPSERATLTLPAVRMADRVWLLVSGAEKAEAAAAFARGADPEEWPVAGATGRIETELFVTEDAAP
ncbi:6-phosphogluconolactonase [Corynebacterium sp. TA-R-1]|uniref:6-phosphogluconolactonase n=1 Tax=Corynebacterium stercoris TaxID=2943490 RepID=A0ABT1FZT6_9CORY|nr:6-phosphogluconolactonase [Corynebacterium stercoris]MCP1387112.1 6-phosphogluconolactonase [Corynebacterium stercoris]